MHLSQPLFIGFAMTLNTECISSSAGPYSAARGRSHIAVSTVLKLLRISRVVLELNYAADHCSSQWVFAVTDAVEAADRVAA